VNLKQHSSVFKWATLGAIAAGALLAAGAANARGHWSVQIGTPGYVGGGYPAPYYAPPPPVYYPAPIYYQPAPPVYYRPPPVYYRPAPVYSPPPRTHLLRSRLSIPPAERLRMGRRAGLKS